MKRILLQTTLLLLGVYANAQDAFTNSGNLQMHTGASITGFGHFTNAASGALVNNGSLYIKGDITNNQSSMTTGTGTLYLNGSSAQAVNGTQTFKTFHLNTNNTSGITINNNLSVGGVHTFAAGVIATAVTPNYLVYEDGATYSGAADNRHVNGWVKRTGATDFAFPVGNGTYLRPVSVTNLSGTAEFNGMYHAATPNTSSVQSPIQMVDGNEYWEINQVSGGTARVLMNWDNSKVDFPNWSLSEIRAVYYNAGVWIDRGGTATGNVTTTGVLTSNAVGAFGYFTLGSVGYVLPLRFISMGAQRKQGQVAVQWKTAQEYHVDHFDIERRDENGVFSKIGSVSSYNTGTGSQYQYMDMHPLAGTAFYRIRGVDRDGQLTYSAIAVVRPDNNGHPFIYVLNNPAREAIHLAASDAYKGVYKYELFSMTGQLVQTGSFQIRGNDMVTIPLSIKTVRGACILNVQNEKHQYTEKIIVQ
jgi:hypothetical protein